MRGDEPGSVNDNRMMTHDAYEFPTCVGMNRRLDTVIPSVVMEFPTCVGMNRITDCIYKHTYQSSPHAWG